MEMTFSFIRILNRIGHKIKNNNNNKKILNTESELVSQRYEIIRNLTNEYYIVDITFLAILLIKHGIISRYVIIDTFHRYSLFAPTRREIYFLDPRTDGMRKINVESALNDLFL